MKISLDSKKSKPIQKNPIKQIDITDYQDDMDEEFADMSPDTYKYSENLRSSTTFQPLY